MNASAFKKGVERVLLDHGFMKRGKSLRRDQSNVSVFVSFDKGHGNQWFISIGFWLHALGEIMADRVEQTHLYFRLERLLPTSREIILTAGDLDDTTQPQAYQNLLGLLAGEIDSFLQAIGTEEGLRNATRAGELAHGLVRKEVRQYLEA